MRFLKICLFSFVVLGLASNSYGATLYAATASGIAGELYIINPATGAVVQDVGPLNDALGTNYPITGLAFHPITGVLYGSTGNTPVATQRKLVTINPLTALVTPIGDFNAGAGTMTDIGFDAAGNLYGIFSFGADLNSINLITGSATTVGDSAFTGTSGGGLAISPGGAFYGTPTASRFGTYDPATGAYTNIGTPNRPGNAGAFAALDFDSGVLYAIHSAPDKTTSLTTIDPASAVVTVVGASVSNLDAIAFQPAIVPEPATIVLFVTGFCAIGRWRRQ